MFLYPARVLAILCAAGCAAAAAAQQWQWQAPNPYPMQAAGEMCFLDANTGFMVGLYETTLATHDGGRNWAPATLPRDGHNCAAVFGQNIWLAGTHLVRSRDGGQTWTDLGFNTAYEMQFLSPDFGWLSDSFAARVTHDGGDSWIPAIVGSTEIIYPDFANEQLGLGADSGFFGGLWRTDDGGLSWSKVLEGGASHVRFLSPSVAIAVGNQRIYRSDDGGLNWFDVGPGFLAYPHIIAFDAQTVIVNAQYAFARSDDGGLTWTQRSAPADNLKQIWIRSGHDAFAVTNSGEILHTNDAFVTWSILRPATHLGLSDFAFLPSGDIVATSGEFIYRSTDNGQSWVPYNSGSAANIFDIEMFDQRRGLAAAYNGYVLRTTDGGKQWVVSRPSWVVGGGWNYCTDIFILDDQIAYISGDNGPGGIVKTTDGGETWVELPDSGATQAMWWHDEQTGWICVGFSDGWIYKTTDGGQHWTLQYGPIAGGFWDIEFHDAQLGWALHEGKRAFRTTDGGATWTVHELPYVHNPLLRDYYDFEFANDQVGYAVGTFGDIAGTTDGGQTWFPIDTPYFDDLHDLELINAQEFWTVGINNVRFHVTDGGTTVTPMPINGLDLPQYGVWESIDILPTGEQILAGRFGVVIRSMPDRQLRRPARQLLQR